MTIEICADHVKKQDYGRYVSILLSPRDTRHFLWVLYALNCELMQMRQMVAKENMMGLIRLQWWRDSIAATFKGQKINHHVLHGLSDVIGQSAKVMLKADDFNLLLESYEADFRQDMSAQDTQNRMENIIAQNKTLLLLSMKICADHTAKHMNKIDEALLEKIATHYTHAKMHMQQAEQKPINHDAIADLLHELKQIPLRKIRFQPAFSWLEIARFDYRMMLRNRLVTPEIYRFLMAFYLWRRNLFVNVATS